MYKIKFVQYSHENLLLNALIYTLKGKYHALSDSNFFFNRNFLSYNTQPLNPCPVSNFTLPWYDCIVNKNSIPNFCFSYESTIFKSAAFANLASGSYNNIRSNHAVLSNFWSLVNHNVILTTVSLSFDIMEFKIRPLTFNVIRWFSDIVPKVFLQTVRIKLAFFSQLWKDLFLNHAKSLRDTINNFLV